MPLLVELDSEHRLLNVHWPGVIDDAHAERNYFCLQKLVPTLRVRAAILDFTGLVRFEVSSQTIKRLARESPILPDPIPRFLVAPNDLIYGMMRMFQLVGEDSRRALKVVRSLDETLAELEVSRPDFKKILELRDD